MSGGSFVCAGCGTGIEDRYLLFSLDRYWHQGCLRCSCCHTALAAEGSTCYVKADQILCKKDYLRLYGRNGVCSLCAQSIPASEMVMRCRDRVYHVGCFQCGYCRRPLTTGDRYYLVGGQLVCETDFEARRQAGQTVQLPQNPIAVVTCTHQQLL
ncbi:LIM domain only protein 3-like [Corticium candelabrum]|uniref:LIM domain only protein 3-like n=1 Tax=Corticium candelabrum TaxID=121492 RepID=UPI002E2686C2|nr:LIM domain only protein 3-like [Corticium candelabrum]